VQARQVFVWRLLVALGLFGLWELAGRAFGPTWTSMPSLIVARLGEWIAGELAHHVGTTVAEMMMGIGCGAPPGIILGLVLGRAGVLAALLRPIIAAAYSVPLITLAPLFILWFGLGMPPKIVLVAIVTFFLLFFNTFSGAQSVDADLMSQLRLMGARRSEVLTKLIAPASAAWIVAGLKIALPYALIAATVGEILASRAGLGHLLVRATSQFDMTGVYTTLVVLMAVGVLAGEAALRLERWLLRWRTAGF
jgi:NitT/TauT family transport system permease protein